MIPDPIQLGVLQWSQRLQHRGMLRTLPLPKLVNTEYRSLFLILNDMLMGKHSGIIISKEETSRKFLLSLYYAIKLFPIMSPKLIVTQSWEKYKTKQMGDEVRRKIYRHRNTQVLHEDELFWKNSSNLPFPAVIFLFTKSLWRLGGHSFLLFGRDDWTINCYGFKIINMLLWAKIITNKLLKPKRSNIIYLILTKM